MRPIPSIRATLGLAMLTACTAHVDLDTLSAAGSGDGASVTGESTDTGSPTTGPEAVCGDGIVQAPEECDDGDKDNYDLCLNTCERATCGDGFVQVGKEICDDGGETPTCDIDCTAASCGDGVVNAMAGEVCDDGNNLGQDGCEPNCDTTEPPPSKFVFVTSQVYTGDLGGLVGADARCQAAAAAAGLPGTYMAWLSDDTSSPATRMTPSKGAYVLPDGTGVAQNWIALTYVPSMLLHPIDMTETQATPPIWPLGTCADNDACTVAWSNTAGDGKKYKQAGTCNNWTSEQGMTGTGDWTAVDGYWTGWVSMSCGETLPLYCFQQ